MGCATIAYWPDTATSDRKHKKSVRIHNIIVRATRKKSTGLRLYCLVPPSTLNLPARTVLEVSLTKEEVYFYQV